MSRKYPPMVHFLVDDGEENLDSRMVARWKKACKLNMHNNPRDKACIKSGKLEMSKSGFASTVRNDKIETSMIGPVNVLGTTPGYCRWSYRFIGFVLAFVASVSSTCL
mmetsp:Transcript_10979/g.12981  ORF Transcript_10979/g.12981 Transcript_10979/m.12981 type:complete len:108 (-) Transcript_10979:221-544(-)